MTYTVASKPAGWVVSDIHQLTFHFMEIKGRPVRRHIPLSTLRGIFMAFIAKANPVLASEIHESSGIPPYTTDLVVHGPHVEITFTLFSRKLNEAMQSFILEHDTTTYRLGPVEAVLSKIKVDRVSLGDIVDAARSLSKFKIVFKKPTYFKDKSGMIVLYPEPVAMFQNLAHIWNEITGDLEPIDTSAFCEWVGTSIQITSHKLKTSQISLGKDRRVTGFVGWAKFKVQAPEHEFSPIINMLLQFARFSHVGGNRTTGLGAIKTYLVKITEAMEK